MARNTFADGLRDYVDAYCSMLNRERQAIMQDRDRALAGRLYDRDAYRVREAAYLGAKDQIENDMEAVRRFFQYVKDGGAK